VLAHVLREDRDELVRQVERALRLVLRCPDHHRDLAGCSNEVLVGLDVGRLGSLKLARDAQRAGQEVDVAELDAERLAAAQTGEGTQRDVGGEAWS
jgi:hypothetical protein